MVERKLNYLNRSKNETVEVDIRGVNITKEVLQRPEGGQVFLNLIRVDKETHAQIIIDPRFLEKGIVCEPGSLLIDQKATATRYGEAAGLKPETFASLETSDKGRLFLPTTNAGWQKGAFWVQNGQALTLPEDETLVDRKLEVFGKSEKGWGVREVNFQEDGALNPTTLSDIEMGFSAPQIIQNGEIITADSILARRDPRLTADPRNVYDWTAGTAFKNSTQREYLIGFLRRVDPAPIAVKRLNRGVTSTSVVQISATDEEIDKFTDAISDGGLNWTAQKTHINPHGKIVPARLAIPGPIPSNRLPLVVFGNDSDGNLIVLTADGRQPESTGLTIDEAAEKMQKEGAINAVLGAAGGDIFAGLQKGNQFSLLNSPSSVDKETGKRITRRVPSILVIG